MDKYADIMDAERPVSSRHPAMDTLDRAAQFAPFSALTGYDAVIAETARLTEPCIELDESAVDRINETLARIQDRIGEQPVVTLTYFFPDARKAGGAYRKLTGHVKKLDLYEGCLLLTDGTNIPLTYIYELEAPELK